MKYFRLITIALFLCSVSAFSQDNSIKHTIVKGETISGIAQKYNVSIVSIYKLNPKAKKTLKFNQVLLIPNSESKKTNDQLTVNSEETTEINHQVLPKETLFGIAKQFKTTQELLYRANPKLETEGLKIGQIIIIPSRLTKKEIAGLSNSNTQETIETAEAATTLTHQVNPKESLYVIAKIYGVSLKELQQANPKIRKKGLSIGQIITIPSNGKIVENDTVEEKKEGSKKETSTAENKETVFASNDHIIKTENVKSDSQIQISQITHEVLPKETKYGIAKKYGITVADLEKQNPAIQQKLLVGYKLNIQVVDDKIETTVKTAVAEANVETQIEKQPNTQKDTINVVTNLPNEDLIDKIIGFASENIGVRYRSGGLTTSGFDCSGLMYSSFGAFDIKLPRTSIEQSSTGEKINDGAAQKGDLIFFKTNGRRHINHVGMVVEVAEDEIKFIHSSIHSGVIISSTKEPYYQRNFVQVNRVIK